MLNINVHGARRYALKKRVLKRWIYSHGYTQREVAKKLHMTTEKFKRKLSRKETFNMEQICRLVYLMGAREAFYEVPKVWDGIKPKDLIGIPWLLAFALRADGWYLRSDIIWHKLNCLPESTKDRPTKCHEYIFLLSKSPKYYYD